MRRCIFSNASDSYLYKNELTARVGSKETEPPLPLCYRFGHTVESTREEIVRTGRVADRIQAGVGAGRRACNVKNPSGRCCLGEVHRTVTRFQEALAAPVGHSEEGREP